MAVVHLSSEGGIDQQGHRSYTSVWQVTVDADSYGPGTIASMVPTVLWQPWQHHGEVDVYARLKSKTARQVSAGDGYVWEVTCTYDTQPVGTGYTDPASASGGGGGGGGGGGIGPPSGSGGPPQPPGQSPTERPWTTEIGSERSTRILTEDLDGKPVANSAGQPFDPGVEIPVCFPTFTITCFKPIGSESLANVLHYTNSINSGSFLGLAAKRVLCTEYKLTSQYEQGQWFWQKVVSFKCNPDTTWNPIKVLDAGTVEKKYTQSGYKLVEITGPTGSAVSAPVPLNGAGNPLQGGGSPVYLDYKGYREISWAGIV